MSAADQPADHAQEEIAIVGMSCVFPGADDPGRFWENILGKVDSVIDPPPDLQAERFANAAGLPDGPSCVGKGGYLGELSRFDPIRYGVMPNSVEGAEPDQFVALRCAVAALEDAGGDGAAIDRERTGVILGRGVFLNRGVLTWMTRGYLLDQIYDVLRKLLPEANDGDLDAVRMDLERNLPPFNAETVPGLVHSMVAGRIANRLDLKGPAYMLDAACASSLLAVEQGMEALRSGRCDAVLAGGVQVSTPGLVHLAFAHLKGLSPRGRIAPFAAEADGTLLGQGCGVVVLKRRGDAERDGNRIYALLKAIGSSSDGKGAGLLAPREEGQVLAIERAYALAGLPPSSVGLVEAHATGIPLGDITEARSLAHVFGPRDGRRHIALGSVKSNIGHLIPASGIASLIKTALALYHRVLPPTLHADDPNPEIRVDRTRFYLNTEARPWIHGDAAVPRRAAIDSFGFGGINAHALLEEHVASDEKALPRLDRTWPAELVVVSGRDRATLSSRVAALSAWLEASPDAALLDVAAACAAEEGACRAAIVACSTGDLKKKLEALAKRLDEPGRTRVQDRSGIFWYETPLAREGRIGFVFPGEGCQYPNMLAELCRHFPQVRRQFDLTDRAFAKRANGELLSPLLFPIPGEEQQAAQELLALGGAVTSVTAASRALLALLDDLGVEPDAVLGHSSGEFGALIAAGAFPSEEDELIRAIAEGADSALAIGESGLAPDVVLTAIGGADRDAVDAVLEAANGRLTVAMDNCPHQLIVAGDAETTDRALEALRGKGGLCERLAWGRPYHTEAFAPAGRIVDAYLTSVGLRALRRELWSCATADRVPPEPEAVKELAVRQWSAPVRFRETVQSMYEAGVRVFVEVGPRGNLSAFVGDTLAKKPHLAVPLDVPRRSGIEQLCRALGMLVASGVEMNLGRLFEPRSPRPIDFRVAAEPQRRPPRLALELPELRVSDETAAALAARVPHAAPPVSAGNGVSLPQTCAPAASTTAAAAAAPPAQSERAGMPGEAPARALADFQRTMRQFLDVQQAIMTRSSVRAAAPIPFLVGDTARTASTAPRALAAATPAPASLAPSSPAIAAASESAPAAPASGSLGSASLEERLIELVSERTGYPAEMLDRNIDLESDLSIDSIKRVEIISAFRRLVLPELENPPSEFMEKMTAARTLQQILDGMSELSSGPNGTTEAATGGLPGTSSELRGAARLPFAQRVSSRDPGRRLVVECELDPRRHRFLQQHTFFGGPVSVLDPELHGVPVMPLAMTLELMAEAALLLQPGRRVGALVDVRTLRWLAFDRPTRRVRTEAVLQGDSRVAVTVTEADTGEGANVVASGAVELVDGETPLGTASLEDRAKRPADWADALYSRTLFHGPAFAGIQSLERCDESGVRATVRPPAVPLGCDGAPDSDLALPVALLDTASQVAGLVYGDWKLEDRYVRNVYPLGFARLELRSDAAAQGPLEAVVRLDRDGDCLRSDLELANAQRAVVLRMRERTDRIVEFPTWVYAGYRAPRTIIASRDIGELFAGTPGAERCSIREFAHPPEEILLHRLWIQVVAQLALGREERREFEARRALPAGLLSWLLGRIVAKDAVRRLRSLELGLADVPIRSDEHGQPGADLADREPLRISLAHKEQAAVAVAADAEFFLGAGIDIESRRTLPPELVEDAFTPSEHRLLQEAAGTSGEAIEDWQVAAWCAKEAVGKALGRGVLGGPRSLEIASICAESGRLSFAAHGPLAQVVRARRNGSSAASKLDAYRRIHSGSILALCLLAAPGATGVTTS